MQKRVVVKGNNIKNKAKNASVVFEEWIAKYVQYYHQGRNHRGGHGGRVPRAPYHVPPYIKITTDSLSSELTFDE